MKIGRKYFIFWLVFVVLNTILFRYFLSTIIFSYETSELIRFLISLIFALSIATFFLFGLDKRLAIRHSSRVPEKTLFLVTLLGGSVGTLFGMKIFHHKTSKTSFQFKVALIAFVQVLIVYLIFSLK